MPTKSKTSKRSGGKLAPADCGGMKPIKPLTPNDVNKSKKPKK